MKRIRIKAIGIVAAFSFVAAACGGSNAASDNAPQDTGGGDTKALADVDQLVFASFGGEYQEAQTKAWLEPYTEETGIEFVQDEFDPARLQAMVEAGDPAWDVVDIDNTLAIGQSESLFEEIDYSIVPKDKIVPGFAGTHRVADMQYATVLAYNTDTYPDGVSGGWEDFFDPNIEGTRALPSAVTNYALEVALLSDGVDTIDLYPLDVERALGILDGIKDDLIYWDTGAQAAQIAADGEADMIMIWNGRAQSAIDGGAPLEINWDDHISLADYLVVPKGLSPERKQAAMEFIAFAVSGDINGNLSDFISYAPINVDAIPKVDPKVSPALPTAEGRQEKGTRPDDLWWDENKGKVIEAYEEWKVS